MIDERDEPGAEDEEVEDDEEDVAVVVIATAEEHRRNLLEILEYDFWPGLRWRWTIWVERGTVAVDLETGEQTPEVWDHDHCYFASGCGAIFSVRYDGDLREGWTTRVHAGDPDHAWTCWVCPECFELYRERFDWTVEGGADPEAS